MAVNVLKVSEHYKNPAWRTVEIDRDGRQEKAICFSADADKLVEGEPVPDDWKVEDGQYGPKLVPPYAQKRPGGGGGGFAQAWRNQEQGFKYEQERMDRRTAIMQAVTLVKEPGDDVLKQAEENYKWLRKGA